MKLPKIILAPALLLAGIAASGATPDPIARAAGSNRERLQVDGAGFVTDATHPKRPGDFTRYDGMLRVFHDPSLGAAVIEFESGEEGSKEVDRYFVRSGRVFQLGEKGEEIAASPLGDLSPATVAALYPAIVAESMAGRRESLRPEGGAGYLFAWNDELWRVRFERERGRVERLERRVHHDVLGDGDEIVRFEAWRRDDPMIPGRVIVTLRGREIARFDFGTAVRGVDVDGKRGDRERDRARLVAPEEMRIEEIAPGLFRIDLAPLNARVFIGEFADFMVVLEGAYNSQVCDRIAQRVRERFGKPIRYFGFSHLHGQYVGGTRSFIREGATILIPPSTAPLIEAIAKAPNDLRPDALSADPKPLRAETVADRRTIEDAANQLVIYNVESQHTDEYFIFYFPRQRVLLTGDLLFYRPGQPLKGRSKYLCETVKKLGLDVGTYYATWPLEGFGTKNVVAGTEMDGACGEP